MGRKKKIPLIATPQLGYGDNRDQRGVTLSQEMWDSLRESVPPNSASSTIELAWFILHGIWYGNADATIEHNGDPLHKAASVLESVARISERDIEELAIRIIAFRDLLLIIRDQRQQIDEMRPNIFLE